MTNADSLPSLAHPLILLSRQGIESNGECPPHRRLPYPEIDPAWAGFEFSSLPWYGLKDPTEGRRPTEDEWRMGEWLLNLTANHEYSHLSLAFTPYSLVIKNVQVWFYTHIRTTFEEQQEQIEVPLDHKKPRNKLEKQLFLAWNFHRASQLVQEVFAVRSSFLNTPIIKGLMTYDIRGEYLEKSKEAYDDLIPGYKAVYNVFDFVAGKIGETAATALVHNVLGTGNPSLAFAKILRYLIYESYNHIHSLATLSADEADRYFTSITNTLDPDDLLYVRKNTLKVASDTKQSFSEKARRTKKGIEFLIGSPTTLLSSFYSDFIDPPEISIIWDGFVCKVTDGVNHKNFCWLLEAIRQQLTTGIGLLCPFWKPSRRCCSSRNRAFLEKVWAGTCPNSNCKLWERLGCLQERKATGRFTRSPQDNSC
jgi:hypothetical protein